MKSLSSDLQAFKEELATRRQEMWDRYGGPPPDDYHRPSPCSSCKGAGWIRERQPCDDDPKASYRAPELAPCPKCTAQPLEEKRQERAVGESGLQAYRSVTFEKMRPYPVQQDNWHKCRTWADRPTRWLFMEGAAYSGKTTMAVCIGNHWLEKGDRVLFRIVPRLLDELRFTYAAASDVSFEERMIALFDVPLLILDDWGQEKESPWTVDKLFQITDHRLERRLPTIVTTNLGMSDFERAHLRLYRRLMDGNRVDVLHFETPVKARQAPPTLAVEEPF